MLGKLAAAAAESGAAGEAQAVQAIAVYPTTSPQDEATTQLLDRLRNEVNPALEEATGAQLYVGGTQAITSDFTTVLQDALPLFLLIVIGLGFLALVILFRSIVVPLTAAVTSLLSFAAAMGITVAVFQWGWFMDLLGIPGTGPIFPFLPIMVFAILFGLSMDYQVFLVSRMQEEWAHTGDNKAAVRRGLAGSGRVVVIAAAIMASVFLAFVPSTNATIKLFGIALASAVIIDAFIVRLVLVPSLMSMLGKANWWLPTWLDRILPEVHIEPAEDELTDDDQSEESATVRA
jgi:RND superfamily putative drug exporter